MPYLLLLVSLLTFLVGDTWQPFALDAHVRVELPALPTEVPAAPKTRTRMWTLRAPEGTYQILRVPQQPQSLPHGEVSRDAQYQAVLTALLRREHGTLVAMTAFPTEGGTGLEFEYKALHHATGKRTLKLVRYLLLDSVGYALNFLPADQRDTTGTAGNAQRRRFFDSLTVTP